jgi:hydroxyethylthiazole kinase-like uncharacterized protein yjeF
MRHLVSVEQMENIDRRAQTEFGLSALLLMENAGLNAVHYLYDGYFKGALPEGLFVFLAGKGNNGGDALVMARQFRLSGKTEAAVILANGDPAADSAPGVNLAACRAFGLPVYDWLKDQTVCRELLPRARVVFDGLIGTGLKGEAGGSLKDLIDFVNSLPAPTIAIDVPSGLGDSFRKDFTAIRAELTLTFGLPKQFLYFPLARPCAGRIVVINPGFPLPLLSDPSLPGELLALEDFSDLLPPVPPDAHKNTRGHLGVFAGAPGTSGAAILASQAAARSRAGMVTLYTDPDEYTSVASRLVSVMCRPVSKDTLDRDDIVKKHRALLIGPGFGLGKEKEELFRTLYSLDLPQVIDADGLTHLAALGERAARSSTQPLILTPHPGECARLLGRSIADILDAPVASALEASLRYHAVCVLKTHVTFIATPAGRFSIVDGMNPALGTGGSGDVLAGLVAGFLTQRLDEYLSARLGVLLHARLGETALRERGWFLAEDLLDFISPALSSSPTPDRR